MTVQKIKIYTSYYANYRKFPKTMNPISISVSQPPTANFAKLSEFAPYDSNLTNLKVGNITEAEFGLSYFQEMMSIYNNDIEVFQVLDNNDLLLCWEKSSAFCHRHILSYILRTQNFSKIGVRFEVKEL